MTRLLNGVVGFLGAFVVVSVGYYFLSCIFGDNPASIITIIPDTINTLHNAELSTGDYLVNWLMIYPTLVAGSIAGLVSDNVATTMIVVLASFGISVGSVIVVVFVVTIISALFEAFIATLVLLLIFATPVAFVIEIFL